MVVATFIRAESAYQVIMKNMVKIEISLDLMCFGMQKGTPLNG
jgi:hypothetical protein